MKEWGIPSWNTTAEAEASPSQNGTNVPCTQQQESHLQCHSEVAGFRVPDNAGVHGWLEAPPPLQVPHGVPVEVAGQNCGETWADPTGRELQSTVGSDEARRNKQSLLRM